MSESPENAEKEEFEELVEFWSGYYEASRSGPTISEWQQLSDIDRDAMREACRRVVGQEISALARALSDPLYALALAGDKDQLADAAMAQGLAASREAVARAKRTS